MAPATVSCGYNSPELCHCTGSKDVLNLRSSSSSTHAPTTTHSHHQTTLPSSLSHTTSHTQSTGAQTTNIQHNPYRDTEQGTLYTLEVCVLGGVCVCVLARGVKCRQHAANTQTVQQKRCQKRDQRVGRRQGDGAVLQCAALRAASACHKPVHTDAPLKRGPPLVWCCCGWSICQPDRG
jgi:hypothetical protein